ncbi:MAG: autotransporter domain-containing protein [Chthoniobacter sp.]|nr:autotransporter domain-containing protein [Chthoniobacter sp.]
MKKPRRAILAQSIGAILTLAALAPDAAALNIWDGGGGDNLWSTNANWNINTAPNFNNALTFGGVLRLTPVNSTQAVLAGINFNVSAGAFTLTGTGVGDAITLNGGITNLSANLQTVSFTSITLGNSLTFDASAADLTVNSNINFGANTLTLEATNDIRLNGSLSGSGGLIKNGFGTSVFLGGSNTYSGTTTLNDGQLIAQSAGAFSPNSNFIVQGNGTLDLAGNDNTIQALNDGGVTTGRVVNSSAGLATLTVGNTNTTGSFGGLIQNFGGPLAIRKVGTGTQTFTNNNTYTGDTTVEAGRLEVMGSGNSSTLTINGGTFVAGKSTSLPSGSTVSVASGAGLEYRADSNAPLALGSLTLGGGSGTTIGGSLGSTLTGAQISVNDPVFPTPGAVKVNVYAVPGVFTGTSGTYTLLSAGAGSDLSTGVTYSLGSLFNLSSFSVSTPVATATSLTVNVTAVTPLASAFWLGGFPGSPGDWAISNGTISNWASDSTGTVTPLVPGAGTTVFFSAAGSANPTGMSLGSNMSIASLVINSGAAPETRAITLADLTGNTLTLAGTGGITVNAGAGAVTLNPKIIVGANQSWTNNSTNLLTLGGTVSNGTNRLTVTGTGDTTFTGELDNGSGGMTKAGTGTLTLTKQASNNGPTLLTGGSLFVDANGALGSGTLTIASAGGAVTLGSSVLGTIVTNPISVQSNFTVVAPAAGNHDFLLTGSMDLNGATRTITSPTNQGQIHFQGIISNGGLTLTTAGLPAPSGGDNSYVAYIHDGGNSHTYTGLTTVEANAFLVLQSAGEKFKGDVLIQGSGVVDFLGFGDQIADTATVTVNSNGSRILGGTMFQGMELFNNNETIGSLFGTGTVGLGSGTLTVGAGNLTGIITDGERGAGGKFVKNTAGALTLAGANTYTGTTTVTGGTLTVSGSLTSNTINVTGGTFIAGKGSTLPATATVTVATGAGFEYRGATDAPLTIAALTLNSGAGTTIGGSIGSTFTSAQILVTSDVTPTPGAIKVNIFGVPGQGSRTAGTYTLLKAGAGSTLDTGTSYSIGNIFNAGNFTVGALTITPTEIQIGITPVTPLAKAFWLGGLSGNPNDWAASNGATASNWASDNTGTPTPLIPGATTDVFFSAAGATDPGNMTLGDDMSIASLTVNDPTAPETRALLLDASGGNTLTLAGAGGIKINSGSGSVTLNPELILGSSQTWTNDSANLFTVGGKVTNGANDLTVAGSGDTTISGVLGAGSGSLTKTGTGTLKLSGSNTYTGGTRLSSGTLFTDTDTALGTGTLIIASTGSPVTLGSNTNNTALTNPISVQSDFSVIAPSGGTHNFLLNGPIDLNGGTRVITGLTHQGQIHFGGVISNGGVTFTTASLPAPVNGDNSYVAFILDGASSHTYTGLTTVEKNAFLVLQSAGEKIRGNILIQDQGVVDYLGFSNQISDKSSVTVNSPGSVILGGLDFAGFELRNFSDTIGVLNGNAAGTVGLGSATLTVGAGNFSGVIRDGTIGLTDQNDPGGGVGGQLVKNTTGTLILSGANTFTGNTSVNNGTLVLNGSVQSPNLLVNFAGSLMGTGTAFHNVRNAGIFAPGASGPGTFHIRGNYLQTGAGTMVIEIAGAGSGQHDRVEVGGSATLDGSLRLVKVGGARLKAGDKVTFLTATGGVTGQFATVDNELASTDSLFKTEVIYETNSVSVAATQGSFRDFASEHLLTPNQRTVGSMLDKVIASGRQKKLIAFLNNETLAQLPGDFDRIAPDEIQALYTIGTSQANVQAANLQHRLEDVRAGRLGFSADGLSVTAPSTPAFLADQTLNPGATGDPGPLGLTAKEIRAPAAAGEPAAAPDPRFGVFITGTGEFTSVGDTRRAGGYDLATGGFTLGADYRLNEHFTVGVSTGYARTGSDGFGGSRVTVDGAKLGVYGTYFTGEGFYADAALQGGFNSYDTRRSALQGTARGSTTGGEFTGLIATGFDFTSDALRIGPIASFQYTHIGFGGYAENGSLAPLRYGSQSATSMRSALGMKAAYEIRRGTLVIRPEMRAAWQHEFGDIHYAIDSALASGGPGFTVQGAEIGRESLLFSAGVALLWNERTATYLYYDGELARSNYSSNNVSAGVRMSF